MRLPCALSLAFMYLLCLGSSSDLKAQQDELVQEQPLEQIVPLPNAHAHNDYHHERPLLDALANGFCSFEADIFLIQGELLVGHDLFELEQTRTLERLYLDPLLERVRQNGGRVYKEGPVVTLLVDIKTNGEEVYQRLATVLEGYREMLCEVEGETYHERAVQIVISGDRPFEVITAKEQRLVGIDGRLSDLESSKPAHLIPLISDRWSSHFSWRGEGECPAEERDQLEQIVTQAHQAGRRVRFWATPESEAVWDLLLDVGVDHLNTDQLERMRDFLNARAR